MKHLLSALSLGLLFSPGGWAGIVDVHGSTPLEADSLIKKYGDQIASLERKLMDATSKIQEGKADPSGDSWMPLAKEKYRLIDSIKKERGFLSVDFQTIYYPNKTDLYTTIEVVTKEKAHLLPYVEPRYHQEVEYPVKKDLIQSMIDYEGAVFKRVLSHQINTVSEPCPVYHCFLGFNYPELKPYLPLFNEGVIKEKKLVLDTLQKDQDPARREAAALLIGHFKDPKEIISVLTPYVQDKSSGLRNNAMRVIGMTMDTARIYDIDPRPFLALLKAPNVTDRNKALYILSIATKAPANHKLILKEGAADLVDLLALKQLNNHDFAYHILRDIAGRDLGEHNVLAWQKWIEKQSPTLV